jgi:hypothetical protein
MRTDVEQLFLDTLRDLEQRVSAQDAYQILGISALIRKLLLDGCPLTDQVNRERRLKIWFEIGLPQKSPPGFPQPLFYSRQDGFDPDTAPPGTERKKVSRDGLLSARVLTIEGKDYTVQVSPRMGRRNSLSFATFSNESRSSHLPKIERLPTRLLRVHSRSTCETGLHLCSRHTARYRWVS